MQRILTSTIICLIYIFFPIILYSQWVQSSTPPLTFPLWLTQYNGESFANSSWGSHRLSANGFDWENILPGAHVVYANEDTLICKLFLSNISGNFVQYTKSYDQGATWSNINPTYDIVQSDVVINNYLFIHGKQYDNITNTNLYRVNLASGVAETLPLSVYQYNPYEKLSKRGAELWVVNQNRLIRSNDNGNSWAENIVVGSNQYLKRACHIGDTLFAINNQNTGFLSLDDGATWSNTGILPLAPLEDLSNLYFYDNRLFSISQDNVYVSDNFGQSWELFFTTTDAYFTSMIKIGGRFLIGDRSFGSLGYHLSNDGGFNWSHITSGFHDIPMIQDIHLANDAIVLHNGYNRISRDGGITWQLFEADSTNIIKGMVKKDNKYYCLANARGVYVADSSLNNWQPTNDDYFYNDTNANGLYAADDLLVSIRPYGGQKMIYSSDDGVTWQESGGYVLGSPGFEYLYSNIGKVFFCVPFNGLIPRTSFDLGLDWGIAPNTGWHGVDYEVIKTVKDKNRLFLLGDHDFCYLQKGGGWSYKTQRIYAQTGVSDQQFNNMAISKLGIILSDTSNRIYYSPDFGDNWFLFNQGLYIEAGDGIKQMESNDVSYFIFTKNDKIWRLDLADLKELLVTGSVYNDVNNNQLMDTGEFKLPNILVQLNDIEAITKTDDEGNYAIFKPMFANDTIRALSPLVYGTVEPELHVVDSPVSGLDFGIYFVPDIHDVSIDMTNGAPFRPGFQSSIWLAYRNEGTATEQGKIKFYIDGNNLDTLFAMPPPSSMIGDTLVWDLIDFGLLENGSIKLTTKLANTTPIGDTISFSAVIEPESIDIDLSNNSIFRKQLVVGSFDPNDKKVEPEVLSDSEIQLSTPLTYTIRFQNTGNYPASFVTISDVLSTKLDPSTFRVIGNSHPMTWDIEDGNTLKFHFDNINLPDSTSNEPASHGFVKYSIEAKPSLQLGDVIENTAYIYFDFNEPVLTNTTVTKVENPSAIFEPSVIEQLIIAPNPTTGKVNITLPNNKNGLGMFRLFSPIGQLILNRETSGTAILLDISSYAKGVYAIWWEVNGRIYNGKVILN